jgi:xanthine dehydrogenase accessory factor
LAYRGVTDLDRVPAPAGLDIGANTPPEIAVAVLAEALAVRSGADTDPLRGKSGPVR